MSLRISVSAVPGVFIIPATRFAPYKRHNAINYHVVRESVAAGIVIIGKEDTETNTSDLFAKVHDGNRRNALCSCMFY